MGGGDLLLTLILIDRFLSTTDEFWPHEMGRVPNVEFTIRGLNLPENVLEKIYAFNFRRMFLEAPKAVDAEYTLSLVDEIKACTCNSPDFPTFDSAKNYPLFMNTQGREKMSKSIYHEANFLKRFIK